MSARSPRGSLSGASSAEVADDFGESLKDLQANNRYEISNLTIIAKENTEHAQAISKTLENHIKTIAPSRKLPALYVLDSIVKNVGTPYTVYLGRSLYSTFMEAYTLVDSTTRRNMEGMLKTWKEPVPGSMDTRPVFPLDTVRPIESALIKAKTAALQSSRPAPNQLQQEYRSTPTPPQYNQRLGAPPGQGQAQPYGYGVQQPTPHLQNVPPNFSPAPNFQQSNLYGAPNSQPVNDLDSVKRDLAALITQRQAESRANPFNHDLQQQLQALRDLQTLLNSQSVNAGSLQQIREQINVLAAQRPPPPKPTPQQSLPTQNNWQPPPTFSQPQYNAGPPTAYPQPPSTQSQPQAPLLAPGALNGLQALLANGQKPSTPQMRAAAPALHNASHAQLNNVQNQASAAPALNANDLLASLAQNGLLPNPTPPAAPAATSTPQPQSTAALLQSLSGLLPQISSHTGTPTQTPAQLPTRSNIGGPAKPRIPMTAASLKTFRPELVHALYDAQLNQCSTCGRRFLATEEGRAKKDRHLDWHFRTNQRMADASISRGAHRDWFLPEIEWINLSDFDPSTASAADMKAAASNAAGVATANKKQQRHRPQDQYVRAPPGVTKNTCSICFEEMRASYSEELQEWIFTNATTMQGGKIVHATCLAEMQKGQQGGSAMGAALSGAIGAVRQRSATPDSSLGKRKAVGSLGGVGGGRVRVDWSR